LVEEPDLQLVVDLLDAVDALGVIRGLELLADAADRPAECDVAAVGGDGDRPVVDPGLPEQLLSDVHAQLVIGHDGLLCSISRRPWERWPEAPIASGRVRYHCW